MHEDASWHPSCSDKDRASSEQDSSMHTRDGALFTGCDASSALEAAHICPYRGLETNSVANGLLLRADVHTLFDLGLIAIDSSDMTIILSPSLSSGHYSTLAGKQAAIPIDPACRASREAIDIHRASAGL
jgi:putative restriction endonuclease